MFCDLGLESSDGSLVRPLLPAHQCDLSSILGPDITCGFSLLLVLSFLHVLQISPFDPESKSHRFVICNYPGFKTNVSQFI